MLRLYDLEEDAEIKVQASIQYFRHLTHSGANIDGELAKLAATVVCYGPDHEERRQAAFCGIQVLGRLDLMLQARETIGPEKRPHISLSARANPNLPLVRHILANWETIKQSLGERFWDSISGMHEDQMSLWTTLAVVADEYAAPRAEALQFIRDQAHSAIPGALLDFLGRIQPKTLLLREHCIRSLLSDAEYWRNDPHKASELLGRDFSEDRGVRESLRSALVERFPRIGARALWALCEICPASPELADAYAAVRSTCAAESDWLILDETEMKLICTLGSSEEVLLTLSALLRAPRPNWQYLADRLGGTVLRRVGRDSELQQLLWARLKSTTNPSEKGTFAALTGAGRQFSLELRQWCQEQCDAPYIEVVAPVGTDLLTGLVRPVREFAADLLFQEIGP